MLNIIKDCKGRVIRPNPLLKYPEFMTDKVFIVGNGNSRKSFNLNLLKEKGTIIGCNALYRTFSPDILTIINLCMMQEALAYSKENFCISLKRADININTITQWKVAKVNSSGCLAIKIVSLLIRPSKCYMLGMDGVEGNIYNNTENYPKDLGRNLDKMFKYNVDAVKESKTTKFINVNLVDNWPEDTAEFMSYEEFEKIIKA